MLLELQMEVEAERIAGQVHRMAALWKGQATPEASAVRFLRSLARKHHVELPSRDGFTHTLNRMGDAAWWRRALRKRLRVVEHHAIRRGAVHRHASPYVSGKALRRHEADRRRLAALLASLEVLNRGTGEVCPLEDVIAASQANPANRRMAMMARIKGVEAVAIEKGHEALFLTITAPGRMHARHSKTGQPNEQHDGSSPRQVQAYLHGVWRRAMRSIQRDGLRAYGMRTVEPHHDGCPHWHVLMFCAPEHADETARAISGLCARAVDLAEPLELTTRTEKWVIQPRKVQAIEAGFDLPWTRFNNCAGPMESTTCEAPARDGSVPPPPPGRLGKRRAPLMAKARPPNMQLELNPQEETSC